METFLEFLREVLKGIVREISAYFFRKNILENKKTTLRRRKQMNCTPIVRHKLTVGGAVFICLNLI